MDLTTVRTVSTALSTDRTVCATDTMVPPFIRPASLTRSRLIEFSEDRSECRNTRGGIRLHP